MRSYFLIWQPILALLCLLLICSSASAQANWDCPVQDWQVGWRMEQFDGSKKAGGYCADQVDIGDGKTKGVWFTEQVFVAEPGATLADWARRVDCMNPKPADSGVSQVLCAEARAENARQAAKLPARWVAHGSWIPAQGKTSSQLYTIDLRVRSIKWDQMPYYGTAGARCKCEVWRLWAAQPGAAPGLWCLADERNPNGMVFATYCRKPT